MSVFIMMYAESLSICFNILLLVLWLLIHAVSVKICNINIISNFIIHIELNIFILFNFIQVT